MRRGLLEAGSAATIAVAAVTATAMAGAGPRRHIWPHAACARSRGVPSAEHGRVAPRALDLEQQLRLIRRRLEGLWDSRQREQQARGASMHAGYDMWALDVIDTKKNPCGFFFTKTHMCCIAFLILITLYSLVGLLS